MERYEGEGQGVTESCRSRSKNKRVLKHSHKRIVLSGIGAHSVFGIGGCHPRREDLSCLDKKKLSVRVRHSVVLFELAK